MASDVVTKAAGLPAPEAIDLLLARADDIDAHVAQELQESGAPDVQWRYAMLLASLPKREQLDELTTEAARALATALADNLLGRETAPMQDAAVANGVYPLSRHMMVLLYSTLEDDDQLLSALFHAIGGAARALLSANAEWLSAAGGHWFHLSREMTDATVLAECIAMLRLAIERTEKGGPEHGQRLDDLGAALQAQYDETGQAAELEATISTLEQASSLIPAESPRYGRHCTNLGLALSARYLASHHSPDLARSIDLLEKGARLIGAGDTDRAWSQSSLGSAYRHRYERTSELSDLNGAIAAMEAAVEASSEDDAEFGLFNHVLGAFYYTRYQKLGSRDDLNSAAASFQQAIAVTSEDDMDHEEFQEGLRIVREELARRS